MSLFAIALVLIIVVGAALVLSASNKPFSFDRILLASAFVLVVAYYVGMI